MSTSQPPVEEGSPSARAWELAHQLISSIENNPITKGSFVPMALFAKGETPLAFAGLSYSINTRDQCFTKLCTLAVAFGADALITVEQGQMVESRDDLTNIKDPFTLLTYPGSSPCFLLSVVHLDGYLIAVAPYGRDDDGRFILNDDPEQRLFPIEVSPTLGLANLDEVLDTLRFIEQAPPLSLTPELLTMCLWSCQPEIPQVLVL